MPCFPLRYAALASVAALLALGCSEGEREASSLPLPVPGADEPCGPEPRELEPGDPDRAPEGLLIPGPPEEPIRPRLLEQYCGECHGNAGSDVCEGGISIAGRTVYQLIASGLIVRGEPDASPLYTSMASGAMPPAGSPRPAQTFIEQLRVFILRTAPPPPPCDQPLVSWDQLYRDIEADLLSQPEADRAFLRYVSLADQLGAGACAEELDVTRAALSKLLNSVSRAATIRTPTAVADALDTASLYRIDLRDYDLDVSAGPFVVNGASFDDGWDAIAANSAYAVELEGPNADVAVLESGTPVPVLFADALIDAASAGELYYGLLRLPTTQSELLASLGVDRESGLAQGSSVLAATTTTPIAAGQRLVVRNEQASDGGYYYERFDLAPSSTGSLVIDDPLGFSPGEEEGSQALFSLPNGLLAYAAFGPNGARFDEAPTLLDEEALVRDSEGQTSAIRVGVSCMRCHERGVLSLADEAREHALANPVTVGAAAEAAGFSLDDVLALYPPQVELQQISEADSARHLAALLAAGAAPGEQEPVSLAFVRFDRDRYLRDVAGALLVAAEELELNVNALDPAFSGLDNGFGADRDDFEGLYTHSLCSLPSENQNRPAAAVCVEAGAL